MLITVLIAAVALTTAFFIGRHARKRGKNSIFWSIFTLLLFGICAVPVYYYSVRKDKQRAEGENI